MTYVNLEIASAIGLYNCTYMTPSIYTSAKIQKDPDMGVTRRVQGGANAPPWNLKMMTSYVLPQQITLIFSLAPSAHAIIAPKFSLKRRKITKIVIFCPQRVKNRQCFPTRFALNAFNFVLTTKKLQKLTVFSLLCKIEKIYFLAKIVLPPGKFSGDAHGSVCASGLKQVSAV